MRNLRFVILFLLLMTLNAHAQDGDVQPEDVTIETITDVYGQQTLQARGRLVNSGANAYLIGDLYADVYISGEIAGEGFGYPVNACGVALTDFVLQPGAEQPFAITLDLYEADTLPERVEVSVTAEATEPEVAPALEPSLITPVTDQEVVAVEWQEDGSLRYAVGCAGSVFTAHEWYQYTDGQSSPITHPDAERVTDALLTQLDLVDPWAYNHSMMAFSPTARRMIYQTDTNTFVTAEPDGSFKRVLYDDVYRHSLQGIIWQPQGRFLAYYFGAYGEPVRYFTATVDGENLSQSIYDGTPSITVPGPTPDARFAVVGLEIDGVRGYYYRDVFYAGNELLFEAELPGNNYPAPIYVEAGEADIIYVIRPVDGQEMLQCFNRSTGNLRNLVVLPLRLDSESRAWSWLSPDGNTLALAANGIHGGLWLIDLSSFAGCPAMVG